MRQSAVSFKTKDKSGDLTLEGVVAQPDDGSGPWPGVVICHPHPLHGGNMDNNVVLALALGLVEEGFVTLRFNFRGVSGSEGEHTAGEMEFQEVLGALDLIKAWPDTNSKTGLTGAVVHLFNHQIHHRGKRDEGHRESVHARSGSAKSRAPTRYHLPQDCAP